MRSNGFTLEGGYAGAERAAAHADRVIPTWEERARKMARLVLSEHGPQWAFTTQLLRVMCELRGCPRPPDERAWGNVTRHLAAKGDCFDTGTRVKAGSHGREIVVWRAR